jgi:hypothetical protein
MSHIRDIKPSFFTDEELAELPFKARFICPLDKIFLIL